jgi:hypothetical protein
MKTKFSFSKLTWAAMLSLSLAVTSCKDEVKESLDAKKGKSDANARVAAVITVGTGGAGVSTYIPTQTWTTGNTYIIRGYVRVASGSTLTIQPGVIVKGDFATKGTLVIERGGKINAVGTPTQPIVFTSSKAAGQRARGDWGGVIILGKAPNNQGPNIAIEGLTGLGAPSATTPGYYGGTLPADNSGSLRYARIEYAGTIIGTNNETNGLTLGSVGSGTTIDHVQVSFGRDDAFEWFGGTVNCRYLYSYRNTDDDFDTDFGYSGKVQFAIAVRDPNVFDDANPGTLKTSNGFESDNDATGSANTPKTSAQFSNVTLLGPARPSCTPISGYFGSGVFLRRNSEQDLYNSAVIGWPVQFTLDGTTTQANYVPGTTRPLQIRNSTLVVPSSSGGVSGIDIVGSGGAVTATVKNQFLVSTFINRILRVTSCTATSTTSLPGITRLPVSAWNLPNPAVAGGAGPNLVPLAGSPLLPTASPSGSNPAASFAGLTGFTTVNFRGALGASSDPANAAWSLTTGWLNYTPNANAY